MENDPNDSEELLMPFERVKRTVLVRWVTETDPKYGFYPEKRTVDQLIDYGIINLNKPGGPTSHQVSAYAKEIFRMDKAGHSGTLDPNVTGVLPVALSKATRVVEYLLKSGKEYVGIMHLHRDVPDEKLIAACNEFLGKIMQLPPIKSAIKRQIRERSIYYFKILEIEGREVLFRVGCQAGTYIRKLIHDVGVKLGVGAHMSELIRTKLATFNDNNWVTLQDVSDAYYFYKKDGNEKLIRSCIFPMEKVVEFLPKIWIMDSSVESLCHGVYLKMPGICRVETGIEKGDTVAVMSLKNELVCLGRADATSEEMQKKEKGVAIKVDKVFMQPGTYPRIEKKEN